MDQKEIDAYRAFMYNQAYRAFMYDPENSHNCAECPENEDFSDWPGTRLPCGQFRCWVDCHCEEEKE